MGFNSILNGISTTRSIHTHTERSTLFLYTRYHMDCWIFYCCRLQMHDRHQQQQKLEEIPLYMLQHLYMLCIDICNVSIVCRLIHKIKWKIDLSYRRSFRFKITQCNKKTIFFQIFTLWDFLLKVIWLIHDLKFK